MNRIQLPSMLPLCVLEVIALADGDGDGDGECDGDGDDNLIVSLDAPAIITDSCRDIL